MKIAVGISGGVDSAVTALLCKEQGHEVIGVTMKIWDGRIARDESAPVGNACFGPEEEHDIEDAQKVCDALNIPLHIIDCAEEFHKRILLYFKQTYLQGQTPNPCVYCNQQLKFGLLPEMLVKQNIPTDAFATGHYARINRTPDGRVHLLRGTDLPKDQTYFLHRLTHQQLSRSLFPLGHMTKAEVRHRAHTANLHIWNKDESMDFYSGDYRTLIQAKDEPVQNGTIVDMQGKTLGTHNGIWNFTIGQRKGLGITGKTPLYVVDINAQTNSVIVGEVDDLKQTKITVTDFNKLEELTNNLTCKVRSAAQMQTCTAERIGDSRVEIVFDAPITGICPGQSAVLYDGELVIGGGIIEHPAEK